jgi:hypothetical protein
MKLLTRDNLVPHLVLIVCLSKNVGDGNRLNDR